LRHSVFIKEKMSCDFGVWYPHKRLSNSEAGLLYARLCDGEFGLVQSHPAIDKFYNELTTLHPEIDSISEDRIDDHDYCPWSCALDRSPGHVIMACVWSKAEYVYTVVHEIALKNGLAVYDPQSDRITYPNSGKTKRRWWHIW
jgi:hypothetical protein